MIGMMRGASDGITHSTTNYFQGGEYGNGMFPPAHHHETINKRKITKKTSKIKTSVSIPRLDDLLLKFFLLTQRATPLLSNRVLI